jgi:hypothetical protein
VPATLGNATCVGATDFPPCLFVESTLKVARLTLSVRSGAQGPSCAVRLKHALVPQDLPDDSARDAISHDIRCEVSKYGTLTTVELPACRCNDLGASWTGDVVLRYATTKDAQRAAEALEGRQFGEKLLTPVVEVA